MLKPDDVDEVYVTPPENVAPTVLGSLRMTIPLPPFEPA
jgi:hypothetical protein